MKADAYISHTVENLPANFVFQPDGKLRQKVAYAVAVKAVRVIAGPEKIHVVLNIRRPYYKALP